MKHIEIKWRDSNRYTYQMDKDEIAAAEISIIKTCGYLIEVQQEAYVIAQDLVGPDFRGVIVIPKENVIYINELSSTD